MTACLAVTGTRSWRASMYRKASSLDTLVADSHRHLPMKRPIRSTPAAASTSLNSGARVAREDTALLLPAAEDAPSAAERAESSALEFYLVASASFVAELGFSCFIPTLYPRLQRLGARDPGSLLGLATSAYCAGQLAGNVLLGHLAHRLGVRIVLAGASLLQAAGTLLFLLVPLPPGMVLAARASRASAAATRRSRARLRRELGARAPPHARVRAARRRAGVGLGRRPGLGALCARRSRSRCRRPPRCSARCPPRGASSTRAARRASCCPPTARPPCLRSRSRSSTRSASPRSCRARARAPPRAHDDAAPAPAPGGAAAAPRSERAGAAAIATCLYVWFVPMVGLALFETSVVPITTQAWGWGAHENGAPSRARSSSASP